MEQVNTIQRIKQFIDFKKVNVSTFEKKINFSNGAFASQLKNNKTIGVDKLENILNVYSDLNADWLLTGKGDMIRKEIKIKGIPFYDTEVIAGRDLVVNMDVVSEPVEMIDAGDWFRDADGAMRVHGDSMQTKYPPGSIIAFKEVMDRELIIFGRDYVIETSEYRILKRLQKNITSAYVLACSYNEDKDAVGNLIHAPFEVPLNKISRLFSVLGKVERDESSRIVYNKRGKNSTK